MIIVPSSHTCTCDGGEWIIYLLTWNEKEKNLVKVNINFIFKVCSNYYINTRDII